MNIYNARMRFFWFSMKLGVISSFFVVCFTMIQIYPNQKIFTKFLQNSYKTHLGENALHQQYIQEKILSIIFLLIDRVSIL